MDFVNPDPKDFRNLAISHGIRPEENQLVKVLAEVGVYPFTIGFIPKSDKQYQHNDKTEVLAYSRFLEKFLRVNCKFDSTRICWKVCSQF